MTRPEIEAWSPSPKADALIASIIVYLKDEPLPDQTDEMMGEYDEGSPIISMSRQGSMWTGDREKTTVSLADFYAPTPDIDKNCKAFS